MVFVLITTIYAISFFSCDTFNPNKGTNEIPTNDEAFFPISEGNYWVYETTYMEGDETQKWQDTLKIGEPITMEGYEGWSMDESTTYSFEINGPVFSNSQDTIYTVRQTRMGGNLFIAAFIFPSGTDTAEFTFSYEADVGRQRKIFIDHTNTEYESPVYKIQTAWQGYREEKEVIALVAGVGIVNQIRPGTFSNTDGSTTHYQYSRTLIEYQINN